MKSRLRTVRYDNVSVNTLMFVCPGCVAGGPDGYDGIHMLPVNAPQGFDRASWDFDGNLEAPTLSPSILSHGAVVDGVEVRPTCHSFLRDGVFEFLGDSTHPLAGQKVPIPDLPEWAEKLS